MLARTLRVYRESFSGLSRAAWLISLASFINRSGTMVIPFLSIYLISVLGFSLEQAGVAMTIFGVGSLCGSYLGGYLTDKIGYYRVFFWSLFLGGALFILLGFVKSVEGIYAVIFVLSTFGESFRPATMAALAIHSAPETRTRSYSLMRMSINLGFTIGPAVGGLLAGLYGYDLLFWVDGITCISAALFFRFALKPKKVAASEAVETSETPSLRVPSPYTDRPYLVFLFLTVIGAFVFLQIISTLPVYYEREMHLSEGQIGALLALNGFVVFLLEMPMVFTLEKRMKVLNCIGAGVLLFGAAYLILNLSVTSMAVAVVSMLALSLGEIFNMPFANSFALSRSVEANRGKYMGMYSMSYSVAHIIGPYTSMRIADNWGFSTLWYLLAGLSVVTFVGFMLLKSGRQAVIQAVKSGSPRLFLQKRRNRREKPDTVGF
ncbi:MAG: MFS transporter [Bacteroidetes bacterium]|nr:MFS transporter [Bacteroidota bacterium]